VDYNWILGVDLTNLSEKEQYKSMVKLHKQFGHHPSDKFIKLMKDAQSYYPGAERHLDKIRSGCKGCLIGGRNHDTPVVGMPMASEFNEKLAIDLKCLSTGARPYILHIIDMWSRLTISILLVRKKPQGVINGILLYWIKYFGVPKAILNDKVGVGKEVREVKSVLNIIDLTTGAESPWQNGLCEKNHVHQEEGGLS
jgi:hypothetical protein